MDSLRQAEHGLQQELELVLETPPQTEVGWWSQFFVRLGLLESNQPAPPLLDQLWQRHERAMEKIRALGHHLDAVERDLAQLDADSVQLRGQVQQSTADARVAESEVLAANDALYKLKEYQETCLPKKALALHDYTLKLQDRLWECKRDRARFLAAEARLSGLLSLQHELRRVLQQLHQSLEALYSSSISVKDSLEQKITSIAAAAAAKDLASQTLGALDDLQASLTHIGTMADEGTVYISENMDALSKRMNALDEEAAKRRDAMAEVENFLKPVVTNAG